MEILLIVSVILVLYVLRDIVKESLGFQNVWTPRYQPFYYKYVPMFIQEPRPSYWPYQLKDPSYYAGNYSYRSYAF